MSTWTLTIVLFLLGISRIHAAILLTNDFTPAYNGIDDPWNVGGDLTVGDTGSGMLNINGGSTVSNAAGSLGYGFSATGLAIVSGTGSMWSNSAKLYIGRYGDGNLTVEAGGSVTSSSTRIGDFIGSTGEVTITGEGSTWENNGGLDIGDAGDGILNIEAGGTVTTGGSWISRSSSATGIVTVADEGSEWNLSRELYIAYSGNGTLNISGGAVNVGEETVVGVTTSANGAINFDGGTLNTGGLQVAAGELRGTGTINSRGLVSDVDLTFDATTGLQQQLNLSGLPDQNITLNLDMSIPAENYSLGAGYRGTGTLRIADGVSADSKFAVTGYHPGSFGTATVTGTDSKWNNTNGLIVGHYGSGTLRIEDGGYVSNGDGTIGNIAGANGTAIVTGIGSTWDIRTSLMVGRYGVGRLDIMDGGVVNVESSTWVGWAPSGVGVINFDGGTFNTGGLLAAPSDLLGTGTINTRGLISDLAVTFDATTGLQPQVLVSSLPNQNITINLDMSGFPPTNGYLGAGYRGAGTLTITDGLSVRSSFGYLGYHPGSTGTATVTGLGSTWNNYSDLTVGRSGEGTLIIEDGATVINRKGYLGSFVGSMGTVTVTGAGSEWNNIDWLFIGKSFFSTPAGSGDGMLHIVNGGLVRVGSSLLIDDGSFINMETGGMLALSGNADDSLADFLDLANGTDAINYWDGTEWADINNALFGVDYTLDYYDMGSLTGYTVLTVGTLPTLAGDFDGDDDVDGDDLTDPVDGWEARFGIDLDGSDFLTWQRQFDNDMGSLAGAQTIPEPSSVVLFLGLPAIGVFTRRRPSNI